MQKTRERLDLALFGLVGDLTVVVPVAARVLPVHVNAIGPRGPDHARDVGHEAAPGRVGLCRQGEPLVVAPPADGDEDLGLGVGESGPDGLHMLEPWPRGGDGGDVVVIVVLRFLPKECLRGQKRQRDVGDAREEGRVGGYLVVPTTRGWVC